MQRVAVPCKKHDVHYQRIVLKVGKACARKRQGTLATVTICRMCRTDQMRRWRAKQGLVDRRYSCNQVEA